MDLGVCIDWIVVLETHYLVVYNVLSHFLELILFLSLFILNRFCFIIIVDQSMLIQRWFRWRHLYTILSSQISYGLLMWAWQRWHHDGIKLTVFTIFNIFICFDRISAWFVSIVFLWWRWFYFYLYLWTRHYQLILELGCWHFWFLRYYNWFLNFFLWLDVLLDG